MGIGNPCDTTDRDLFYAATTIYVGDGRLARFWLSPWLDGMKPKDIASTIFAISANKNKSVREALLENHWIQWINMSGGLSVEHIEQFCALWGKLTTVHLHDDIPDDIKWNLTADGIYSSASAYRDQFEGAIASNMTTVVWKNWAPPKCKFFAWLVIKDRIWTADRLQRRGWPNCNLCQLCKREPETAAHLLFRCRFFARIWNAIRVWVDAPELEVAAGNGIPP